MADYQRRLLQAEHLVFAFPIWWESMPAATKGFLDRVLTKGLTFEEVKGARGNPFRCLLPNLRTVTVLTVMTTPDKAYRWWFGKPAIKILLKGTFSKIGVKHLRRTNYASSLPLRLVPEPFPVSMSSRPHVGFTLNPGRGHLLAPLIEPRLAASEHRALEARSCGTSMARWSHADPPERPAVGTSRTGPRPCCVRG